jgi:23S rRNA C2498 (ribose-2'-O)-methylase RlmM
MVSENFKNQKSIITTCDFAKSGHIEDGYSFKNKNSFFSWFVCDYL